MFAHTMRPKFNADTSYIPVDDGVYLRSNSGHLTLKGKSLYRLLEHLVPLLDGNVTLEEITRGLDADRARMVTKLIEKLSAHHFLKDMSQDQPHTLRPEVLATYSSAITFIESFQSSAAYRFERFRNQPLLIIGSGASFVSLVRASLRCGMRQINLIVTSENEIGPGAYSSGPGLFSTYDAEQRVQAIDAPCWDDEAEVLNAIQEYDAILYVSEQPMLARARLLNKLCAEQQKTLIQAIVVDDHAWVGPMVSPENKRCWECAWRRLQSNLPEISEQLAHYEFRDQPTISTGQFLTKSAAIMIGNRLIFELFKHYTQIGFAKTAENLIDIDLESFMSTGHSFLPHPHCLTCQHPVIPTVSQFLAQVEQLRQREPVKTDTFMEDIARCVDERLGLFTAIDSDKFVQAPLAVYQVNLSNPMLRKSQNGPLNVVAASTDVTKARLRALQRACEKYAANFVDRRRLLSADVAQQQSVPTLATDQAIRGERPLAEAEAWTWAVDLHTRQACFVPATLAFSSLADVERGTENERGIASGMTWEEAICQALLDWCNCLTLERLNDTNISYSQIDLVKASITSEGSYVRHLLNAVGGRIIAYDVTGELRVPTFATCLDGKVVTYSTHWEAAQALGIGLERALQQYQSMLFQQLEYAVTPVPDLPPALRSDQLRVPHYTLPEAGSDRMEWLLQKFQANGLRAIALPLDHDPALAQVLPYIVRVLLVRAEVKHG
ncbi:MAG TPA: TOMM precursor leader peptide-binding protein [Ktedonobacteraceae bacterium]|nr:TOMM precursor leader peptide-binding protein [Ktedonobacteraceae bacterium]